MTLPSSGAISMSAINTELGYPSTNAISFEDAAVLALAGKSAGAAIAMSDFYGKTAGSSLRASASPSNQTKGGTTSITATVTVAAAGGTAPYTYASSVISAGGASASITSGATTTTPTVTVTGSAGSYSVVCKTIVTDHTGAQVNAVWNVTAVLSA